MIRMIRFVLLAVLFGAVNSVAQTVSGDGEWQIASPDGQTRVEVRSPLSSGGLQWAVSYRGVTVLDGTGWYSKKPVKVISVLVRKPESALVFSLVHEIDPNALVSIADVSGVFGSGFDKIKAK